MLLVNMYRFFTNDIACDIALPVAQKQVEIYHTSGSTIKWFIRHAKHCHHFYRLTQIVL